MMKKFFLSALLFSLFAFGYGQPKVSDLSFPNSVDLFGLYEIAFDLGRYDNPYDPDIIDVYAEFVDPSGNTHKVNGFYYEAYTLYKHDGYEKSKRNSEKDGWRIRFTPDQVGSWKFVVHAVDRQGEAYISDFGAKPLTFQCDTVKTGNGFISMANTRYMKRAVVKDGKRQDHSFFPIGPNVAWYSCKSYYNYTTPVGIFDYEKYIDSLSGNANYMRIWLSRYQYLSLYGPEFTQGTKDKPTVYFDSSINQKDAEELDCILRYATEHGISIMPCFFTFGDFTVKGTDSKGPGKWGNNPYHTVLGLEQPHEFFSDREARKITKNLIRYIVARWGYSPSIMAWELWNEVFNIDIDIPQNRFQNEVFRWHNEMADYIRSIDPFHHLVTTSLGNSKGMENMYKNMDIVQIHNYQNIDKAISIEQFSYKLYNLSQEAFESYPDKPFFVGEFGFGSLNYDIFKAKDPFGVDLHNSLWSSLFSGSMGPASFWFWDILSKGDLFRIFKPVYTFCEGLPIPSDSFTALTTGEKKKNSMVFPNNIETYYMINGSEDTIYGWCQDTAFCYQSLRHLTEKTTKGHFQKDATVDRQGYLYTMDVSKRPRPSSTNNTIVLRIAKQATGTEYDVRWFNAETGLEIPKEATKVQVKEDFQGKYLSFEFPHAIRDLKTRTINNTYGDAVFILTATPSPNGAENNVLPTDKKAKRTITIKNNKH